jgi:hypothetical protein
MGIRRIVCYDLNKIFSLRGLMKDEEIYDSASVHSCGTFFTNAGI